MRNLVYGFILLLGILITAYIPSQSDFTLILSGFILSFAGYYGIVRNGLFANNWTYIFGFAFIIRFLLLFSFPNLSDDIYRFYWDAIVVSKGMSPYAFFPLEIKDIINDEILFKQLNSPEYYSVYPPINQLLYFLAFVGTESIQSFASVLKVEYLLFDITGLYFLRRLVNYFQLPMKAWSIYAFNPLVIIEGIGNLHIEIVMTALLIVALFYAFCFKDWLKTAFFFSAAVGVKLVPLIIGPFLFFRWGRISFVKLLGWSMVFFMVFFGPIIFGLDIDTFSQSLDLYFRKFEFNASIYYIFRSVGYVFLGYNLIGYLGPLLSIIVLGATLYFALKSVGANFFKWIEYLVITWTIYLLFSTIVHPWYLIPVVLLSSLSTIRFPLIWSFLIILSYGSYNSDPFQENLLLVTIEYGLLGLFIWREWKLNEKSL